MNRKVPEASAIDHSTTGRVVSLFVALLMTAAFATSGLANTATWNNSGTTWNIAGDWTPNVVPNSSTADQAYFTGAVTNNSDIVLGANIGLFGTDQNPVSTAGAGLFVNPTTSGESFTIDGSGVNTLSFNASNARTHNYEISIANNTSVTINAAVTFTGSIPDIGVASGSTLSFSTGLTDTYNTPIDIIGGGTVNLGSNINGSTVQNVNYVVIDAGTVNWNVGTFTANSSVISGFSPAAYNQGSAIVDRATTSTLNFQTNFTYTTGNMAFLNTSAQTYSQSVYGTVGGVTVNSAQEFYGNPGTSTQNAFTIGANVTSATPVTVTYEGGFNTPGISNTGAQGITTYDGDNSMTVKFFAAAHNTAEFNEVIGGTPTRGGNASIFQVAGPGIVEFDGTSANTYTLTTMEVGKDGLGGELLLAKSSGVAALTAGSVKVDTGSSIVLGNANQMTTSTNLTLAGGTFNAGGFNNAAGTLTVNSGSITLGTGAPQLTFANSSGTTWSGTLTINGTVVNGSTMQFGTDNTGLTTAQLADIVFTGLEAGDVASLDSNGFLDATAVPEPSTVMLFGIGALGLLYAGRFRRTLSLSLS